MRIGSERMFSRIISCIRLVTPREGSIIGLCTNRLPVFSGFTVAGRVGSLFKHAISVGHDTCLVVSRTRTVRIVSIGDNSHAGTSRDRRRGTLRIGVTTTARVTQRLHLHSVNNVVIISFVSVTRDTGHAGLCSCVIRLVDNSETQRGVLPLDGFKLVRVAHRHIHPTVGVSAARIYPGYRNANGTHPSVLLASRVRQRVSAVIGRIKVGGFTMEIRPCITTCLSGKFPSLFFH